MRIICSRLPPSLSLHPPMRHQVWKDCHLFRCDFASGCSLLFGHQTEMKDVSGGGRSTDAASVCWSLLSTPPPSRGKPGAGCLGKAFVCIFDATCYSEVCAPAPHAYCWASDGFLPPTDWKWKRVLSFTSSLTLFPMVSVLGHLWLVLWNKGPWPSWVRVSKHRGTTSTHYCLWKLKRLIRESSVYSKKQDNSYLVEAAGQRQQKKKKKKEKKKSCCPGNLFHRQCSWCQSLATLDLLLFLHNKLVWSYLKIVASLSL